MEVSGENPTLLSLGDPLHHIVTELIVCESKGESYISVLSLLCKSFAALFSKDNSVFWNFLIARHFGNSMLLKPLSAVPSQPSSSLAYYQHLLRMPYRPCALCHQFPITGVRYKCLTCASVDLCEACEASEGHPPNHLVYKTYYPEFTPQVVVKCLLPLPNCSHCGQAQACYHQFISFTQNYVFCAECRAGRGASNAHHEATNAFEMFASESPDLIPCLANQTATPSSARLWKLQCGLVSDDSIVREEVRGKNPRGAWCDMKLPGCITKCTAINWKCTRCFGYDVCTACEATVAHGLAEDLAHSTNTMAGMRFGRGHTTRCALLKIYYVNPHYKDWNIHALMDFDRGNDGD
jgi:hypothetical protein